MSYADEGTRPMTHLEEQQRAEIDRLRAEIEDMKRAVDDATEEFLKELDRAEKAEARLGAVITLWDQTFLCECIERVCVRFSDVRAAATGDPK